MSTIPACNAVRHNLLHIIDFGDAVDIFRLSFEGRAHVFKAYLAKCIWIWMDINFLLFVVQLQELLRTGFENIHSNQDSGQTVYATIISCCLYI